MSVSKDQVEEKFKLASVKKNQLTMVPKSIQEYLQFMDYKIRKQFKSFTLLSLCGTDRGNFLVENNFQRAFGAMILNEKTQYYRQYIENVANASQKIKSKTIQQESQKQSQDVKIPLLVAKGVKSLTDNEIILNNFGVQASGDEGFRIDLRNYLLRKSKKKDLMYVLQAIRNSDPVTIRFGFHSLSDEEKYLPIISKAVNLANYENIEKQILALEKKQPSSIESTRQLKLKMNNGPDNAKISSNQLSLNSNALLNSRRNDKLNRSVIQNIVRSRDEQQLDQQLTQMIDEQNQYMQKIQMQRRVSKQSQGTPQFQSNRNIFKIILPNYSIRDMTSLHHYGSIYQSNLCQLYVYQNVKSPLQFKMQFSINLPLNIVCKAIYNVQLYKQWHPQIEEGQVKIKISSQNSCILYQKLKAFSQWHKARDYILLAHMFRLNNSYYIIEKSIENSNYVPFHTITRGNFQHFVWRIEPEQTDNNQRNQQRCRIFAQLKVSHNGLLNRKHQKDYTLGFLKGFEIMEAFYKLPQNQKKLLDILGFEWSISDRQSLQKQAPMVRHTTSGSVKAQDFDACSEISERVEEDGQVFYSIDDLSEQQKQQQAQQKQEKIDHEVEPRIIQKQNIMQSQIIQNNSEAVEEIKLDSDGLVILPKKYLKKKQPMAPSNNANRNPMEFPYESIVLKDHWVLEKGGGLKLVNQVKIDAQNGVIKFIMKTLKKNLFSGKGLMNISLPVQIFNVDSNLQRICQGLSLGPQFLEKAVKANNPLERFKQMLAFGLSNTVIYIDVEKPFNPILGETYQGFIRGCPIYAQQISHHPPITSIYFIGRGYKIYGNFQGKVKVHMNSGEGSNDGYYHVIFDDGEHLICTTPPAQLSGLAMGDRRFNVKGAGYYIDKKNNLFCELVMEQRGGLLSKKKRQFADQIDGQIVRVKPEFINKFMQEQDFEKKPSPNKSDIIQKLGEVYGRWPLFLKIDGITFYDVVKDIPDKMVHDPTPLNSNSNYREDLLYRKKNDLSRSQIEKERLEVLQRGDRKLREKFHGKAH